MLVKCQICGKKIDRETNMVTLITNIPANSSGYMINEMGIYEDNMLIAICTCQPIMKPSQDDNYVISINLNIELHSYNLASIYDRIILNVDSSYIQPSDLEQGQPFHVHIQPDTYRHRLSLYTHAHQFHGTFFL